VKSLSQTQWSERADAAKVLHLGYDKIFDVHVGITNNHDENADTRLQAEGMVNKMVQCEYGILTDLWAFLLNRYNVVTMALQSSSLDQLLSWNYCVNMLRHCANSSTSLKRVARC